MAATEVSPGFEGVEKVLEIDFAPGLGPATGLHGITRPEWDLVLQDAKCTILDTLANSLVVSYVLSESSLFVYPLKMVIKTCGTTTLLAALPRLLGITQRLGMKVEWLAYTRKDFKFPQAQKFPHRGPQEEIAYLKDLFPEGSAFLMGPVTGDHWLVFVADYVDRPTEDCADRTLDIMMFDLDPEVAKLFIKDEARFPTHQDVSRASGISGLLPGSAIQEYVFDPCGYSMNGLLRQAYWTIHITPESHCSYASFETNLRMVNYVPLVKAVLDIFRPARFTMTLFADEHGLKQLKGSTGFPMLYSVPLAQSHRPGVALLQTESGDFAYDAAGSSGGSSAGAAAAVAAAVATAAAAAAGGGGSSSSSSAGAAASAEPSSSSAAAAAAEGGADRGPLMLASYVQTHKSMSEFMGYSCFMGNYSRVCVAPITPDVEEVVALAATTALSGMPRAKYVLPHAQIHQRVVGVRERARKESIADAAE